MSRFTVGTTTYYARLAKALQKKHPEFVSTHASALEILSLDPYNSSRRHHIKKLEGILVGEGGQYRLSLGRWRFRYDVQEQSVILHYCGLRRESTY